MKRIFFYLFSMMAFEGSYAQWGAYDSRTENRDDAGSQGASTKSGFYQTMSPVNFPGSATSWWHLLDVRHDNPGNNYAMQFAGSFFDQDLYFRKTNNSAATTWSKIVLERGGITSIGSTNPIKFTDSWMSLPEQGSNISEISNEIDVFKCLMIAGNRSAGGDRRVGIWDRLDIGGTGFHQALNVTGGGYFTGNTGIGISNPSGLLHIRHSGISRDNSGQMANGLVIESAATGRSSTVGAQLEFVIPANTDGSNPWGQARIITVAGSQNSGDATGRMILGTRRIFNKTGTGQSWYYGDDITIDGSGNVGINTLDTKNYKFAVNGSAAFTKVVVKSGLWPDYVFDSSYHLTPLREVAQFIKVNKHLSEVPSATEVNKEGLNLGDNQAVLLRKIEELTLYIIGQDKQLESQKAKNDLLEARLEKIEKMLSQKDGK